MHILIYEQKVYEKGTKTVKLLFDEDGQYNGYHQEKRQYLYCSKKSGKKSTFYYSTNWDYRDRYGFRDCYEGT